MDTTRDQSRVLRELCRLLDPNPEPFRVEPVAALGKLEWRQATPVWVEADSVRVEHRNGVEVLAALSAQTT
jgi:hypothetical protein